MLKIEITQLFTTRVSPPCWQMMSSHEYIIRSHVATSDHASLMKTLDWSVETLGRECNSMLITKRGGGGGGTDMTLP